MYINIWWEWGLSGLHTYKAGILPLEPHHQSLRSASLNNFGKKNPSLKSRYMRSRIKILAYPPYFIFKIAIILATSKFFIMKMYLSKTDFKPIFKKILHSK
jgi:hypothetical protein